MRISLKHTILLSTALVSMNVSVMATDTGGLEKVITSASVVEKINESEDASSDLSKTTIESVATENTSLDLSNLKETVAASDSVVYTFLEHLGLQQNPNLNKTFDQTLNLLEIESYVFLDQQYVEYLNDRFNFSENKIIGIQTRWTKEQFRILASKNPEANILNETLFDKIYSLTNKNASQAILDRFNKINAAFAPVIKKLDDAIAAYKTTGTTATASQILEDSKKLKLTEKENTLNNLKKSTFDLIVYRNSISNLLALKKNYLDIKSNLENSMRNSRVPDGLEKQQKESADRQIENINKEIQAIECFMHSKYPFSRSRIETLFDIVGSGLWGKRPSKSARFEAIGVDDIPESLYIPVTFESKLYLGIDSDILKISKDFFEILYGPVKTSNDDTSATNNDFVSFVYQSKTVDAQNTVVDSTSEVEIGDEKKN